ncbi:MAG TPA: hypothetical protein VFY99_08710 [Solirubrobacterales bacterium]
MALKQRGGEGTRAGECRRCRTFCDKLIEPRGCVELGCPYLYSYDDELSGRRYLGCLNRVFGCEIDVDAFEAAERSGGYGGVKMTGKPMPHCQFTVEPSYEGDGKAYECINPRFFDCTDEGVEGLRVFDLRDALA